MTIAEKLYRTDPDTLFEIIVRYQLEKLARLYFSENLVTTQAMEEDYTTEERERLMRSSTYSGRVEKHHGVITQPHRQIIK